MQQRALVTIFGLVLVASVGYALTRMAAPAEPAAFSGASVAVDEAAAGCPYSGETASAAADGCCPSGEMDAEACDMHKPEAPAESEVEVIDPAAEAEAPPVSES